MADETEDVAQRLHELRVLQRVADAAGTLDLDEVLGQCVDLAREVARTTTGVIYLRDDQRGVFARRVARDALPSQVHLPIELVEGVIAQAPYLAYDLDLPVFDNVPQVLAARAAGFRMTINIALKHGGQAVGLLVLGFREPVVVPESTMRTLLVISGYQAAAIENARTHRLVALRAKLALALREFGERALQPADDASIYRLILDCAIRLARGDRALVARVADGRVQILAGDETLAARIAPGIDDVQPLVVEEVAGDAHGTASFVRLTLRLRGAPIGTLLVGSSEPRRWEAEEIEALRILSSMAAEVIERARAQAALESEARRLSALIEHLPIFIALMSREGELLELNAAARRFIAAWNLDARSLQSLIVGLRADEPGVPRGPVRVDLAMEAARGDSPAPREATLYSADGTRKVTLLTAAAPLRGADGQVEAIVLGSLDVTALRELADDKDRFLRVASHELRSPVTALRVTTQLLARDPAAITDEERRGRLLDRIDRQGARLVKLVEQLLESARLSTPQATLDLAECDLVALTHEAVEECERADRRQVVVHAPAPVVGRWDGLRLVQVLTNLISNALRYSPPGAEVTVRVESDAERARIEVTDRGIGIPATQLGLVFTPFFRGDNATAFHRGGLGLGLYITHEIVRRHGGRIEVRSEAGRGSTFTIELPRYA